MAYVECYDIDAARVLLEYGADPNSGEFGYTPLSLLKGSGPPELIELLKSHGARP